MAEILAKEAEQPCAAGSVGANLPQVELEAHG